MFPPPHAPEMLAYKLPIITIDHHGCFATFSFGITAITIGTLPSSIITARDPKLQSGLQSGLDTATK